jgi:hypothetical protein
LSLVPDAVAAVLFVPASRCPANTSELFPIAFIPHEAVAGIDAISPRTYCPGDIDIAPKPVKHNPLIPENCAEVVTDRLNDVLETRFMLVAFAIV